jgi:hypothetical protein
MPAGPILRGFKFLNWSVEIFWAVSRLAQINSASRIFNFLIQLGLVTEVATKQAAYQTKIIDGKDA